MKILKSRIITFLMNLEAHLNFGLKIGRNSILKSIYLLQDNKNFHIFTPFYYLLLTFYVSKLPLELEQIFK